MISLFKFYGSRVRFKYHIQFIFYRENLKMHNDIAISHTTVIITKTRHRRCLWCLAPTDITTSSITPPIYPYGLRDCLRPAYSNTSTKISSPPSPHRSVNSSTRTRPGVTSKSHGVVALAAAYGRKDSPRRRRHYHHV